MWQAYDAVEPLGGKRADWHNAALLSFVANRHRNREVFPEPFKARDFLMDFDREAAAPLTEPPKPKKAQSAVDLLKKAKYVAALYNRDNANRKRKEQERIERKRTRLGERKTNHGR